MNRKRRQAVSRIEIVAVLGSALVLFSLWLPMLVSGREAARKIHCASNLQRIGAALTDYHHANRVLPPGYMPGGMVRHQNGSASWRKECPSYSWAAHLLPYLGYEQLHDQLDINRTSLETLLASEDRSRLLMTRIGTYLCPSDLAGPSMATAPVHFEYRVLNPSRIPSPSSVYGGSSSYVGSAGYFSINLPQSLPANSLTSSFPSRSLNNGVLAIASNIRFEDVTDGLTNTIPMNGALPTRPIPNKEQLGVFQRLGIRNDGLDGT